MLKTRSLHPGILAALGEAGHGAQVLIADGNYPLLTRSNGAAHRVYLNLAPGLVTVTDVLGRAGRRDPDRGGPRHGARRRRRARRSSPSSARCCPGSTLQRLGRFAFYDLARGPDVALAIATGEQRIYANLLLTIGVVSPE